MSNSPSLRWKQSKVSRRAVQAGPVDQAGWKRHLESEIERRRAGAIPAMRRHGGSPIRESLQSRNDAVDGTAKDAILRGDSATDNEGAHAVRACARPGDDQLARHRVRPRRVDSRRGAAGVHADYPQPGWVEHDPTEIWATQSGVLAEALAKARHRRRRPRGDRHHQPARDHGAVGARDRRAGRATPSSGRTGAPRACATRCARRATRELIQRKTGLVLDAYFSGTKLRWLLDNVAGARERASAASSPSAPSTPGWSGSSPAAPSTSPTLPTQAARCCSTSITATGTTSCWRCSTFRARAAATWSPRRACARMPRCDGAIGSDRRHRRRPAGGAVRPGLPAARPGQEHLRHRLLHAAEHRHAGGRFAATTC